MPVSQQLESTEGPQPSPKRKLSGRTCFPVSQVSVPHTDIWLTLSEKADQLYLNCWLHSSYVLYLYDKNMLHMRNTNILFYINQGIGIMLQFVRNFLGIKLLIDISSSKSLNFGCHGTPGLPLVISRNLPQRPVTAVISEQRYVVVVSIRVCYAYV